MKKTNHYIYILLVAIFTGIYILALFFTKELPFQYLTIVNLAYAAIIILIFSIKIFFDNKNNNKLIGILGVCTFLFLIINLVKMIMFLA
ncbi:hypothetical protein SAMN05446037_104819 [Anaerovirgula multivorans]|uniref:Uncharacterized protein n=1 Tax=Anaerovirgula multivorans TaxID=312168 RepID=A0A239KK73_9FIRM|nr:hypothetical protein [Anaerovirgula multivorans]SNT18009.1 hypothetical protein SAMN05446037_104819 [Anaerovirgula multivorans]